MSTYNFEKVSNGVRVLEDGVLLTRISAAAVLEPIPNFGFRLLAVGYEKVFRLEGNSFEANGAPQEVDAASLNAYIDLLGDEVFVSNLLAV